MISHISTVNTAITTVATRAMSPDVPAAKARSFSQKPVLFPALISLDVAVAARVFSAGPGTVTGFVVCVTSRPIATFPLHQVPVLAVHGPRQVPGHQRRRHQQRHHRRPL